MGRPRKYNKGLPPRVYRHRAGYRWIAPNGTAHPLGRDLHEALLKWASLAAPKADGVRTMEDVFDRYIATELGKLAPRTREDYLDALVRLRRVFGTMEPSDIKPMHVYRYLEARRAKVRANREVATLSAALNTAIKLGLIERNPCREVRRNPERPRDRLPTDAEIAVALSHGPEWLRLYARLKLLIGARQGDMLTLTLDDVREDGLYIEQGKTGKRQLFALTVTLREVIDALKQLRRVPGERALVVARDGIALSGNTFRGAWQRMMKKAVDAGVERFTEHDLRAKVASDNRETATEILGHDDPKTTRRHYVRGVANVQPGRGVLPIGENITHGTTENDT